MSDFEGIYYNGRTSVGVPVNLVLNPTELLLIPQSGAAHHSWEIGQIHRNDFNDQEKTVLKYGSFPHQYVEVESAEFMAALKAHYPAAPFSSSRYRHVFKSHNLIGLTILLAGLVAGIYFFVIPQAAEWVAASLPESTENSLGHSLANTLLLDETIDSAATVQAQRFFNNLGNGKTRPVSVTVVEHRQANAFAVPGGHIIIYRPIIAMCQSYEEFAALLAHEYAHVQHRHSLRALFRNLSSYLVLSALFSDANGIMAVVIENGNMLKSLEFSRELEQEADQTGLAFLAERGVNPNGMVQLFTHLKEEEGSSLLPEFISTHPLLDSRIGYLKEAIGKQPATTVPQDSLQYYWQQLKNSLPAEEPAEEEATGSANAVEADTVKVTAE